MDLIAEDVPHNNIDIVFSPSNIKRIRTQLPKRIKYVPGYAKEAAKILAGQRVIIPLSSSFTSPYNFFFRYFGINTMWYWHSHLQCAKLGVVKKRAVGKSPKSEKGLRNEFF